MSKAIRHISLLFFVLLLLVPGKLSAQSKNQLAFEYYRNNDFEKASTLFLELYQERSNQHYRNYYIQSLVKSGDLETAEKFIQKELRKYRNDLSLKIEQAYIWEQQGEKEKAMDAYNDIIENETLSNQSVINLANTFLRKRKYELAEKTYKAGQKNISNQNFYYQLANLYAIQRKYEPMAEAYMDLLEVNPSYLTNIQTRLQNLSVRDIDDSLNPILEKALIRRIQENPDNPVFTEMLIWQYVQTGQYRAAKDQAIALDKRRNERGKRLYELGKLASQNGKKKIAAECFEYIYQFGRTSPWYFSAKLIELSDQYNKLTETNNPSEDQLLELEAMIKSTLNEAPRKFHYQLVRLLAELQAFYLNEEEIALKQLDSLINTGHIDANERDALQLLRGDIYLINDNPWEASLIYAKTEQNNKENPLGAEAKFRKARLAYYTGQFEWAKAQLDVLKASTSKLIANDAFELSLFIKENVIQDSLQEAMNLFARADLYEFSHSYDSAMILLDSIAKTFPTNELADDVLLRKARIYAKTGAYEKAVDHYNHVVTDHGWGILADNALIAMARLQENKLKDNAAAIESYKQLLLNHKGSIFVTEARDALRRLRSDVPEIDNNFNPTTEDE
jgi:tetratricopeptide (TPR) repeat protein